MIFSQFFFGLLVGIMGLVHHVDGLNLLISQTEMIRTLGVKAELSYIENGVVNGYSTKFPFRVAAHVDHVIFTWDAMETVSYSLRAESEDSSVLPILRVSPTGEVPHFQQNFIVEYRCAGHRSGHFVISLFFVFKFSDGRELATKLRQEKICATKDGRRGLLGTEGETEMPNSSVNELAVTFYIIIGVAGLFLLIVTILLFSYFRKSKKGDDPERCQTASTRIPNSFRSSLRTTRSGASAQPFITSTPKRPSFLSRIPSTSGRSAAASSSASSQPLPLIVDKPSTVDVRQSLIALHADRELFQVLPFVEIQGTFGELRFAIWRQEETNGDVDDEEDAPAMHLPTLCKTLKKAASQTQLEKFLIEALAFYRIPAHPNLAQVACAASFGRFDDPATVVDLPLICYRHQGFGLLKKFLVNCRDGDKTKGGHTLRTHDMTSLCLQLSRAVTHLHHHGLLHKDIASRNCLIAEQGNRLEVQMCDAALSRDLFPQEYDCLGDNDNRPIRWMSPETIAQQGQNTSASDVWSLGVLFWEVFSLGALPYSDIDAEDLLMNLQKGSRLLQPYNCPDPMYQMMFICWRQELKDRPAASQVTSSLQDFTVQLNQFI